MNTLPENLTDVLASLESSSAVLGSDGDILAVNEAWMRFAQQNGAALSAISAGVNYVDVCRRSAATCPEAQAALDGIVSVLRGETQVFRQEYRCDGPDIDRWFLLTATSLTSPQGALVCHTDISQYKLAVELHRLTMDSVGAIIWTADADTFRTTFVSGRVQEILGFTPHDWLNDQDLWRRQIHPEDRDWVLNFSRKAVREKRDHEFDYRIITADGRTIWLRQIVKVVQPIDCSPYLAGISIDTTEIHEAQEQMRVLTGRLLKAQDEERAHIARELHDSTSQSLALIQTRLTGIEKTLVGVKREQLSEVNQMCTAVAKEIHAFSHRLHPSKLDLLGLVANVRSFCKELATAHDIHVQVEIGDITEPLPPDVRLCLFRVLQESLQNAIKHSRTRDFRVTLGSGSAGLYLRVHDSGIGFDPSTALSGTGLGLVSMKERLHLLGGTLKVTSSIGAGTTVEAQVPLSALQATRCGNG